MAFIRELGDKRLPTVMIMHGAFMRRSRQTDPCPQICESSCCIAVSELARRLQRSNFFAILTFDRGATS